MASSQRVTLTPSTAISGNGATTSDAVQVDSRHKNIVAALTVSGFTDGTFDTVIQHSYDGVVWDQVVVATIPQANAAELQTISLPAARLLYVRAVTTAAAVTVGATIQVDLFTEYGARRS